MNPLSFRHHLALRLLCVFPQIRMIALCNSRAMGEGSDNSDIDLFIITRKGRLWTARCITTLLTSLLCVRRRNTHGLVKGSPEYIKRTKGRFCLSFFITEDALSLEGIRLKPDDPYLDRWISTLVPLVDKHGTYEHFMEANGLKREKAKERRQKSGTIKIALYITSFFESFIKKFWGQKTLQTYEKLGKPWGVVLSDTMLKFHDNDQRLIYREKSRK